MDFEWAEKKKSIACFISIWQSSQLWLRILIEKAEFHCIVVIEKTYTSVVQRYKAILHSADFHS